MRYVLAEPVNLIQTGLFHGVLEVNVLTELDLLIKQLSTADAVELVTVVLQAADDTS